MIKHAAGLFVNGTHTALIPLVLMLVPVASAQAAEARADLMEFEIPVAPEAARYADLLAYPPFIAVALENNGIKPSNSGRVIIVDHRTLQFKGAEVRFLRRQGMVFHYQGDLEWDIGVTQAGFKLPVEADLSALADGKVKVYVHLPMAKIFPRALTDRIRLKIRSLAGPEVQKRMLDYLDGLSKKTPPGLGIEGMLEPMLIDAYNLPLVRDVAREPGDAEPLSDQWMLIATLVIWLVILPLAMLARSLWHKYRRPHAQA